MYISKKPQELEINDSFHSELESAQVKDTYPLLFMFISRNWKDHFKYSKQRLNYLNNLDQIASEKAGYKFRKNTNVTMIQRLTICIDNCIYNLKH
jgi:hypothetical protein